MPVSSSPVTLSRPVQVNSKEVHSNKKEKSNTGDIELRKVEREISLSRSNMFFENESRRHLVVCLY